MHIHKGMQTHLHRSQEHMNPLFLALEMFLYPHVVVDTDTLGHSQFHNPL